jgi:tetratricopeptide (TPR) repeat protein/transcriptional regulator with XRE-family HTH domain
MEPFGVLLRKLRIDARLTQEELANAAQLSYRSISDLERGVNLTPRRETARLLADALHLSGADRAAFEAAARGRAPAATSPVHSPGTGTVAAATRALPRDVVSFTGRERELAYLMETLTAAADSGDVLSICAIGGMAGIGKTALAIHAAHRIAPRFPDGQIFLSLHGHTPGQRPVDPADALASVLQASGIPSPQIPAGLEQRVWMWRDHLAGRRMLLVLDDACGHEQITPLLPGTGGSVVLVTSRSHLTALEGAYTVSLDILRPDDAAALLVRLAVRPGSVADDSEVRDIIRLCGYLPLAVGMIARQLHHHPAWTPGVLARDLAAARDRLEFMQAENVSVAAAFDLSYQDLSPGQQRLFRRLGLHPGIDIDAYAAAALDDASLVAVRRHLAGLYDLYLLAEPAYGRYRMHDLIAEHARVLAATDEVPDREAALDRLLDYYLFTSRISSRQYARRSASGPPSTSARMPAHVPDLSDPRDAAACRLACSACIHAATIRAASCGRPGYAIDIPAAVHGYLRHHGNWAQALTLHETALEAARQTGDLQAQASALTDIGDIYFRAGNYQLATISLATALGFHRSQGNQLGEANALCIMGYLQHLAGSNSAAEATLSNSLELYLRIGDHLGQAGALAYLSRVQLAVGNYQAAEAGLKRALELSTGEGIVKAGLHFFLGTAQRAAGNYDAASVNLTIALEAQGRIGNPHGEAEALRELGYIQHATGDFTAATASLTHALKIYRSLGTPRGEAEVLQYLGKVRHRMGEYAEAADSYALALGLYRRIGYLLGEAEVLNAIGDLLLTTGATREARARCERACAIAVSIGSLPQEAQALESIGLCLISEQQSEEAVVPLRRALEIYERIGSPNANRVCRALVEFTSQ